MKDGPKLLREWRERAERAEAAYETSHASRLHAERCLERAEADLTTSQQEVADYRDAQVTWRNVRHELEAAADASRERVRVLEEALRQIDHPSNKCGHAEFARRALSTTVETPPLARLLRAVEALMKARDSMLVTGADPDALPHPGHWNELRESYREWKGEK